MRTRIRRALPGLALLALGACAPTDYYLLPPPAPAAARTTGLSMSVADVSLPAYAEALEIAATDPASGAVRLSKDALWADTPRRALTRHLVAALQTRLGGTIASEPWPGFDSPDRRLEVIVDRMIGAPDGPLSFEGQYILVTSDGRIAASQRFAITVPSQGPGYPGLLADHARAIEILADQIAARVSGRRTGA